MRTLDAIGLLFYLAFYLYFDSKLIILQRKKGIKTFLLGRGTKPKKTVIIEIIAGGTLLLTSAVQFISIVFAAKLPALLPGDLVRYYGLVLSAFGGVTAFIAMWTMQENWRLGIDYNQDTQLVTSGIYRYSRNPYYVGFDLFCLGMALLFANMINIIFACASMLVIHLQILEEEKFLRTAFGKEYTDYQNKTDRYWGRTS